MQMECRVTATGDEWQEVRDRFGLDSSEGLFSFFPFTLEPRA